MKVYYYYRIIKTASWNKIEIKFRTSFRDVYLQTEYKSTANSLLTIAARYKKIKVGTFYISFYIDISDIQCYVNDWIADC